MRTVRPGLVNTLEQFKEAIVNADRIYRYALEKKYIHATLPCPVLDAEVPGEAEAEELQTGNRSSLATPASTKQDNQQLYDPKIFGRKNAGKSFKHPASPKNFKSTSSCVIG